MNRGSLGEETIFQKIFTNYRFGTTVYVSDLYCRHNSFRYKLSNNLRFIPKFSAVLVKEVFIYIW